MSTFLFIAMIVSGVFHFVLFHMMGRTIRVALYQHRILAAFVVLGTDFVMLIFIGAGNIVGVSNLGGGLCLALWIFIRGAFCRDRVHLKRVYWILPKLVIQRRLS